MEDPKHQNLSHQPGGGTSAAFFHLDIVDGDVVNLPSNQKRKSPVTFSDFPDVLDPSTSASLGASNGKSPTSLIDASAALQTTAAADDGPSSLSEHSTSASSVPFAEAEPDVTACLAEGYEPSPNGRNNVAFKSTSQGAGATDTRVPTTTPIPSPSLREMVQMGASCRTDFPLIPSKMALLIIDVQTYCCDTSTGGPYYATKALPQMLSNIGRLLDVVRSKRRQNTANNNKGNEVIFTMIQAQTTDGRDLSIDYKLSGPYFENVPKVDATYEDMFLPQIMPLQNQGDITIPKTSCSVFVSTNLDFVLRNLAIEQVVICGQLTEQCVESAVRDAADLGYLVTVVEDACATYSRERHVQGLKGMKGFCRICSTDQILKELCVGNDGVEGSLEKDVTTANGALAAINNSEVMTAPAPSNRRVPLVLPLVTPPHLEDGPALAILKTLTFAKVKFLKYISMDASNAIQSIVIPVESLKQQGSLNYPWSSTNGKDFFEFQPDPASLQFASPTMAVMFGTLLGKDGLPSEHCTRHLLHRVVRQAHDVAPLNQLQSRVALSFTLNDKTTGQPIDDHSGATATSKRLVEQEIFISTLYDQLKEQEINIASVTTGDAPGQFVVNLGYQGPVKLSDQIVATQETVNAVAQSNQLTAEFRRNEASLFLSFPALIDNAAAGTQVLAGLVQHVRALFVISGGGRSFGKDNDELRAAVKKSSLCIREDALSQTMSIQYGLCESSFNPYMTMATILACSIDGVQNETALSAKEEEKAFSSNQTSIMPSSLESDDLLMSLLGPGIAKTHVSFRVDARGRSHKPVVAIPTDQTIVSMPDSTFWKGELKNSLLVSSTE